MEPEKLNAFKTRFFRHSLYVSAALFIVYLILKFALRINLVPNATLFIILFFVVLSNFLFYHQLKLVNERILKFVNRFMVITALKLFTFLFIILIYGFIDRKGLAGFALAFMVVYFTFTVFEVSHIIKVQKLMVRQ